MLRKIAADEMMNKDEMLKLIKGIENEDRTFIIGANDILEEYE